MPVIPDRHFLLEPSGSHEGFGEGADLLDIIDVRNEHALDDAKGAVPLALRGFAFVVGFSHLVSLYACF